MDEFVSIMTENLKKDNKKYEITIIKYPKPEYFNTHGMQEYVNHRIKSMKEPFLKLLGLKDFFPINYNNGELFYTFGMIISLTGNEFKNGVFFCNTEDNSNTLIKLNIEAIKNFSLYNGLLVALKTRNIQGNELLVEKIIYLPISTTNNIKKDKLNMVIARGIFNDNSIEELINLKKNIIILFGPFCEFKNGAFNDFDQFIQMLEDKLSKNINLKIILVPSLEDNNFIKVFPQVTDNLNNERILLVNNPSCFYIDNHLIAVSNFDTLFDLYENEYFKENQDEIDPLFQNNRNFRLSYLLISQKSFSPIIPSLYNVAYGKWLDINITPNIFITFSKLQSFTNYINSVTFINIGESNKNYHMISNKYENYDQYNVELDKSYLKVI